MTNYTIIDNNLITNLKISDGAYRCYNLLLSMCYADKCTCYPSIEYIATALGRSCRTINRYLKELVELGLIVKRRRGSISSIYTLLKKKTQQIVQKVKDKVNKAKNAYKGYKNDSYNNYDKNKVDTFNNYPQREYNWKELENKLLGLT